MPKLTQQHLDAIINTAVVVGELKTDMVEVKENIASIRETVDIQTTILDRFAKMLHEHDIELKVMKPKLQRQEKWINKHDPGFSSVV